MSSPGGPWRREVTIVTVALLVSVALLCVFHYAGDPAWVRRALPPVSGSDAVLWTVQTTFLSVGFAGLTIAAQLFADAPLAIGTSRKRILAYIGASWFVTVGLVANAVMALESIWLPSASGVILSFAWFVATAALLLVSTSRLTHLFGHPSRIDEVVRASLVDTLTDRLDRVTHRYADATKGVDELLAREEAARPFGAAISTLTVPVPEPGRVVRSIRSKAVRQASGSLGLRAIGSGSSESATVDDYAAPRILLDVHPGDRTRLGDTAFRVVTSTGLDPSTAARVVRLLQSSIAVEPREAVTPYEETEREIATLKDAIGTNLRSGALDTAERALELLGHIVRGAWMTELDRGITPPRGSLARGIGLFQTIGEVERDALLSPQAAHVFISAATVRALEAPETGSTEYVDECLRSFTRQWSDILRQGGPEFEELPVRIVACVRDLIAYSDPSADEPDVLRSRGVWAMVELVKLAVDAGRPDAAGIAAAQLRGLLASGPDGSARTEVRAGLLVLSAWLGYLAETDHQRSPTDPELETLVRPDGSWPEIFAARDAIDDGAPFLRWDTWEAGGAGSTLPGFLDRAQLSALVGATGTLPDAEDDETAAEYARLLRLIPDADGATGAAHGHLRRRLQEEIGEWDAGADRRLARGPVSRSRVEALAAALRAALDERGSLSRLVPDAPEPPEGGDEHPILGMNFAVPRDLLADADRPGEDADVASLGRMIAGAFADAEDRRLVEVLREVEGARLGPAAPSVPEVTELLRAEGEHFVLLTPYGGPGAAVRGFPPGFAEALDRLTPVETGALDAEVIVFDRRTTLRCHREPERGEGLSPAEGTRLALGVFDDVRDRDGSRVRVQVGESLVAGPGEAPRVFRFGRAG